MQGIQYQGLRRPFVLALSRNASISAEESSSLFVVSLTLVVCRSPLFDSDNRAQAGSPSDHPRRGFVCASECVCPWTDGTSLVKPFFLFSLSSSCLLSALASWPDLLSLFLPEAAFPHTSRSTRRSSVPQAIIVHDLSISPLHVFCHRLPCPSSSHPLIFFPISSHPDVGSRVPGCVCVQLSVDAESLAALSDAPRT